jgi:hypothetical protein
VWSSISSAILTKRLLEAVAEQLAELERVLVDHRSEARHRAVHLHQALALLGVDLLHELGSTNSICCCTLPAISMPLRS